MAQERTGAEKIELPKKTLYRVLSVMSLIVLIGTFIFLLSAWPSIPDVIPRHYDVAGQVDGWGSKFWLLVSPIISAGVYLLVTVLERSPAIWAAEIPFTGNNRERVLSACLGILAAIKFDTVVGFAIITVTSVKIGNMGMGFTLALVGIVVLHILYYMYKIYKMPGDEK